MSATNQRIKETIPQMQEKAVSGKKRADLQKEAEYLLGHITPALCKAVFGKCRQTERERKWSFHAIVDFWIAMVIDRPKAIEHGLSQTRKGRGRNKLWPRVMASGRAFFKKAASMRPYLFQALYEAFLSSIMPQAPAAYASWIEHLRHKFTDILIVDGSQLDAICRQLKILRKVPSKVIPGCITVFYDVFRGIARKVLFFPDANEAELPRARHVLKSFSAATLLVGDRLYASTRYFYLLSSLQIYGLFRRNKRITLRRKKLLSRITESRTLLEDSIVNAGCGRYCPIITLRLIRYRHNGKTLDLLTSVLDPELISAADAVALYGLRWSIERMFLDVKETLDLHTLYASHPNLVAQQLYATAIVHAAFRIAQARLAQKAKILPEQLSPAKLFPRLAKAMADYCNGWIILKNIQAINPGRAIKLPNLHILPSAYTTIASILVRRRIGVRRKRRFCQSRKLSKSFKQISGGPSLLKFISVSVD